MSTGSNSAAVDQLRSLVDRWVNLENQKAAIAEDIGDLRGEAKSFGYDTKAMAKLVKERRESHEQKRARQETEDIADLYRGALGMLDGTPLGEDARRRWADSHSPTADEPENTDETSATEETEGPSIGPDDIQQAREAGRNAARDGISILQNPFVAGDPRRAGWDEGWCLESGSDGMDIPKAWQRSKPPKGERSGEARKDD
jgi:uncharacterized protein (UPF0335 family)